MYYEEITVSLLAKDTGLDREYLSNLLRKWLPPITAPSSVHMDAYKKASDIAMKYGLAWAKAVVKGKEADAKTAFAHEAVFRKIATLAQREVEIATYRERQ